MTVSSYGLDIGPAAVPILLAGVVGIVLLAIGALLSRQPGRERAGRIWIVAGAFGLAASVFVSLVGTWLSTPVPQ